MGVRERAGENRTVLKTLICRMPFYFRAFSCLPLNSQCFFYRSHPLALSFHPPIFFPSPPSFLSPLLSLTSTYFSASTKTVLIALTQNHCNYLPRFSFSSAICIFCVLYKLFYNRNFDKCIYLLI